MKVSYKSLISTSTKFDISQKKFGDRSSTLSNLSNIGFPIIEGFFISYDIMKQIEIGQQTPEIPCKFLECGPFCLRSSTNNTEIAGLEPFLYLGLNKEKIDELSSIYGKKKLSQIYLNHIKNFGIRVFDLETDFFDRSILKTLKQKKINSVNI